MTDVIPLLIDGAIVFSVENNCTSRSLNCEECAPTIVYVHNWIKQAGLEYVILDFQEEKDICPVFLEELIHLKKRVSCPFLFAGTMDSTRIYLESYNCGETYPMFVTPEDAIRALRMQHPGLTESPLRSSILFNVPMRISLRPREVLAGGHIANSANSAMVENLAS